jgi:hypothetical protein
MMANKQYAHRLLDQLDPSQFAAVLQVLEVMVDPAGHSCEEPLTEEDRREVAASREWFEKNPEGIPFEQVVAECGLTMDAIKNRDGD